MCAPRCPPRRTITRQLGFAMLKGLLIGALLAMSAPASASNAATAWPIAAGAPVFDTGNELWSFCGTTILGSPPDLCMAYVAGADDAYNSLLPSLGTRVCQPTGATIGQVTDVVRHYLNDHPDQREKMASSLVWVALVSAFPCRTPPGQ